MCLVDIAQDTTTTTPHSLIIFAPPKLADGQSKNRQCDNLAIEQLLEIGVDWGRPGPFTKQLQKQIQNPCHCQIGFQWGAVSDFYGTHRH